MLYEVVSTILHVNDILIIDKKIRKDRKENVMAKIKPFYCVRPNEDVASLIAALPYDVYSREEAAEQVKDAPLSFLNVDRPETQFPSDMDMYAEEVYQKAREILNTWMEDGTLIQEETKCYYLYELTMAGRTQTGLVVCASVDDYENQVIKKHENTREDKEKDRIAHVDVCSAQTGPIFLACRENKWLSERVGEWKKQQALYDFVSEDGIRHRVFKIEKEEEIDAITKYFQGVEALYIADGHHRTASAVKVSQMRRKQYADYTGEEEFNYFLSVIFPENELKILDYNRVVKDLNGLTKEQFLELLQQKFDIKQQNSAVKPEKKMTFGMYLEGTWYELCYKEDWEQYDVVDRLDVSVLQKEVLAPILGIQDPKTDERIQFVGGIRGVQELEKLVNQGAAVAFSMYPTAMEELFAVADEEKLMPPKSTWFEPKLRSGLFIHKLES